MDADTMPNKSNLSMPIPQDRQSSAKEIHKNTKNKYKYLKA